MTPERWQQIKRLCELALDREPDERAAFLSEACAADPELRQQVEDLLQHATVGIGDSSILAQLVPVPIVPSLPAASHLPHQIGRYRVVRMLGEGGMGTVYEAEQDSPRRRVALKVVRAGLGQPRAASSGSSASRRCSAGCSIRASRRSTRRAPPTPDSGCSRTSRWSSSRARR